MSTISKTTTGTTTTATYDSSVIARTEYDAATHELIVEFVDGTTYKYSNTPKIDHERLINACSTGFVFNYFIRWNYNYEKIAA